MTESAFKRPPRLSVAELEDLLARIGEWLMRGDTSEAAWFQADHANASAPWVVRVDVEWPLGQARWGHSEMYPVDPHNVPYMAFKAQYQRSRSEEHADDWSETDDEPLAATLLRWEVDEALERLPTVERQCVEAVVFGQMSVRDAAEMLGMSYPTVWRRVQSGKRKLAEILHHHG